MVRFMNVGAHGCTADATQSLPCMLFGRCGQAKAQVVCQVCEEIRQIEEEERAKQAKLVRRRGDMSCIVSILSPSVRQGLFVVVTYTWELRALVLRIQHLV